IVVAVGLIGAQVDGANADAATSGDEAGVTVWASGEATIRPNRLEIDIKAAASAELTGDAVVKYRDALKRAKDAFDKLKIEKLEIVDRGMNVANSSAGGNANNFVQPNMNQQAAKPEVNISKTLRLEVTGIDKMSEEDLAGLVAKLLDTAKDAGVVAGPDTNGALMMRMGVSTPSTVVTYVADDPAAARKKASEDAFRQAKERAQRLADLAGARLGPVLSMEETGVTAGHEQSMQEKVIQMVYGGGNSAPDDSRLTSSTLMDMPVRVGLKVRFALEPKAVGAAQ
ncbi:MAG TPA: SIMPL domain-containing protein, partial [Pirellulales bacterium]